MNLKALGEVASVLVVSAGCGILLYLFPHSLTFGQRAFFLVILAIVVVSLYKTLPPQKGKTDRSLFHAASARGHEYVSIPFQAQQQPKPDVQEAQEVMMRRYFAWLEKKLAELVEREELQCGLVGIKRGPLVITLRLRLINPTHRDLRKLLRLGPALAQLLQVEAVRIADTAQGVMIEVPSPQPLTPNGVLLANHTQGLRLAIGVDAFARPVSIDMEDHGAVFWVGPSRRGKTQSMKASLYAVLRANGKLIRFVIIASPAKVEEDWGVFGNVAGCLGIACTKEEIAAATQWLVSIMNSGKARAKGLHIIVIIDDLPKILKAVPSIQDDIADLAGMGAGLGIHLWAGTQGAGSKRTSGGTDVENNVTARILYRPATARTGSQSAGIGGLDLEMLSSYKGDALVLTHGLATRIATAWIADQAIALLPEGKRMQAPWHTEQPGEGNLLGSEQAKTTRNRAEQGLEQSESIQSNPKTSQNNLEQRRTTVTTAPFEQRATARNGHDETRVAEHVLEQPSEQGSEQKLERLAQLSIEALKIENLGCNATRFPKADEQAVIRSAFGYTRSIRKTCFMIYGHYNGKVRDYVKAILGDAVSELDEEQTESRVNTFPERIDLATPEGRALLEQLKQQGYIRWPDANDVLTDDEE